MAEEQVTRTLPAPFIEAAGTTLTEKLMPLLGQPIDTSAYAQTVAAQDPLQQQAYQQASGLGSFEPFLALRIGVFINPIKPGTLDNEFHID